MLILTRKPGESIIIGGRLAVTIRKIGMGHVMVSLGDRHPFMLVHGQHVEIMDGVAIRLNAIKGNQAAIGVRAPRSVSVNREEIEERIRGVEVTK